MSHPMNHARQSKVEHSRVGHITKHYASGGAVNRTEDDRKVRKMSASQEREVNPEGGVSPHRADRPKRAKGGRVKKGNAKTIVNVITGGHPAGGAIPPMPAPPMGVAPPGAMPPPRPPMATPPGAGPGMPPPGGPPMMRAKGGAVKSKGMDVGTKVTHDDGKSDLADMNRKKVVTFASGGKVKKFHARIHRDDGGTVSDPPVSQPQTTSSGATVAAGMRRNPNAGISSDGKVHGFAKGGRVESPDGVAKATKLPGGGGGGEARLAKAHRAARK